MIQFLFFSKKVYICLFLSCSVQKQEYNTTHTINYISGTTRPHIWVKNQFSLHHKNSPNSAAILNMIDSGKLFHTLKIMLVKMLFLYDYTVFNFLTQYKTKVVTRTHKSFTRVCVLLEWIDRI